MTPAGTTGETPLLARKGMAAPTGMTVEGAGEARAAATAKDLAPRGESAEQPGKSAPPRAAAEAAAPDLPPAASLLPIDFTSAGFREAQSDNLLRLEPATAGREATPAPAPFEAEPRAAAPPAPRPRSGVGFGAVAAVIAVVAVAGLAVWRLSAPPPESTALSDAPAASDGAASGESAVPQPAGDTAAEGPGPATQPSSAPTTAAAPPPDGSAPAEAPSQTAAPAAASVTPSVDVVDLQPDGSAVIAGRAAPGSELIVLDGDTPIGTVKADSFGEWVLVPETALPVGEHAFGLVIKKVHGTVLMPAPESKMPPAEPAATDEEQSQAPLPTRKPERTAAEAADPTFVVQLASVKTRDGAMQEWEKLKSRFPELLADKKLTLDEAEVKGFGPVVRVRAGPFADHNGAKDFCASIATGRQHCLVVRTSGGS